MGGLVPEEWGLRLSPAQLSLAKFGTELANFNALRPWINVAKGSKSDQNNTLLNKSDRAGFRQRRSDDTGSYLGVCFIRTTFCNLGWRVNAFSAAENKFLAESMAC